MTPRQYTLWGMGKHRCSSEQEGSGCKDTDLAHLNQLTWRAVGVKTLTLHTWSTHLEGSGCEDTDLAHLINSPGVNAQWAWRHLPCSGHEDITIAHLNQLTWSADLAGGQCTAADGVQVVPHGARKGVGATLWAVMAQRTLVTCCSVERIGQVCWPRAIVT